MRNTNGMILLKAATIAMDEKIVGKLVAELSCNNHRTDMRAQSLSHACNLGLAI